MYCEIQMCYLYGDLIYKKVMSEIRVAIVVLIVLILPWGRACIKANRMPKEESLTQVLTLSAIALVASIFLVLAITILVEVDYWRLGGVSVVLFLYWILGWLVYHYYPEEINFKYKKAPKKVTDENILDDL